MAQTSTAKPRRKRSENLDLQRMRRLYDAMQRCSAASRNGRGRAALGTEVPALLDLRLGDVVVTPEVTPALRILAGAQPLRRKQKVRLAPASGLAVQLGVASGIALHARQERKRALVTIFADVADRNAWRDAIHVAAQRKLPMLMFLLTRGSGLERLIADANAAGVASMLVDAADSVAVYRICQEAHLRARMGDGPAFVIGYLPRAAANPLRSLAEFLREHKYPVDQWEAAASRRSRRKAAKPRSTRTKNSRKKPLPDLPFHVITVRR